MIKEELYNKTVGILVDAYFNNTLRAGDCAACAVGNIIAANKGYIIRKGSFLSSFKNTWATADAHVIEARWQTIFCTNRGHAQIRTNLEDVINSIKPRWLQGKKQILSTGYTIDDMAKVEYAFETTYNNSEANHDSDPMFDALCAVIDVLDKIHQNNNVELTKTVKQKFVKV